jgi:hypothetical protein
MLRIFITCGMNKIWFLVKYFLWSTEASTSMVMGTFDGEVFDDSRNVMFRIGILTHTTIRLYTYQIFQIYADISRDFLSYGHDNANKNTSL